MIERRNDGQGVRPLTTRIVHRRFGRVAGLQRFEDGLDQIRQSVQAVEVDLNVVALTADEVNGVAFRVGWLGRRLAGNYAVGFLGRKPADNDLVPWKEVDDD